MGSIGFSGQIRKFDNQIHFNFIQIRQILSYRENYTIQIHSLVIRFNFSVKGFCIYVIQFKKCFTSIQIRDRTPRRRFPAFKFERGIRIPNKFIQIRVKWVT